MNKTSNSAIIFNARQVEKRLYSPSISLVLMLATIGAVIYIYFLLQPQYRGDLLPYFMVLFAEFFIVFQGTVAFWTILSGRKNPKSFSYHYAQKNLSKEPSSATHKEYNPSKLQFYVKDTPATIDVFIPVFGEPIDEIALTATAARDIHGKHKTYILDDGKSDEVKILAKRLGINYIRRESNKGAKAGNINNALRETNSKFFIIFDADFVPSPRFIEETLPFMQDEKIAFVQTPQFYGNHNNFVSTASSYMQHVFYTLIQPGKNRFNAAFCVGTNVLFRRSSIERIGGIYEKSKSEDIWTSLKLHERGYHSVYLNKVLAIGKAPETLKAYSKQQLRWATGSFEIFLHKNPLFNKKLTIDQRFQYLAATSFYFNGLAVSVLLLLPVMQIFFNITPISLDIPLWQWLAMYSGFYILQIILSMYTMGGFRVQTLMLSMASFPIYIKAFFNALRRKDEAWNVTNSKNHKDSPFNYVRVQTYIFLFIAITTLTGVWKSIYNDEFSISIIWAGLNTLVFGIFTFVALTETRSWTTAYRSNDAREQLQQITSSGVNND